MAVGSCTDSGHAHGRLPATDTGTWRIYHRSIDLAGTLSAITQVLHEVEQPFIDQEVELLMKETRSLLLDLDLTHRQVSNTSTTYPGAQFGWQDDKVGLGYDAALVTLTSRTYGRLFLSGFHHPRNTMSLPRLQKMVYAAEERLGRRPRRRTELVEQRRRVLNKVLARRQGWSLAQIKKQKELLDQLETLPPTMARLEAEIATLEATYRAQGRKEKPHSQLAKARRRLAAAQRKLAKAPHRLQQAERAVATHRARLDQLEATQSASGQIENREREQPRSDHDHLAHGCWVWHRPKHHLVD